MFFAHSRPGPPDETWDPLEDHLQHTARVARQFFPLAPDIAYLAGLWHDVGKYQLEFLSYLKASADPDACNDIVPGKVKHSIVGAALANQLLGNSALSSFLSWPIAAHHGGLANRTDLIKELRSVGIPKLQECRSNIAPEILNVVPPSLPIQASSGTPSEQMLWIRMLLSSLSDADMLVSEEWDKGEPRPSEFSTLHELRDRFERRMAAEREKRIHEGKHLRPVNVMRTQVLQHCLDAAQLDTGQYTLTVPTGGGKTLSSLAFALHHACLKGLQRVIMVIPFTSIIEQTAEVYREYLGEDNVVEHHSTVDLEKDTVANQRACENWDAPVIVTTSVQFFESLYAARKTRCRKLHNIANSVVVLDEVQSFPVDLLAPIRRALGTLTRHFGCTVLHCTATQPTPEDGTVLGPKMNPSPKPIIVDPRPLYEVVKHRFRIVLEGSLAQPIPLEELALKLRQYPRVMAIVHNRKEAEQLARMIDGCWHLSARMCAAHRKDVLDSVRSKLKNNAPCRLVATQLIEAGVDISFPVVFRALAGVETLAQAAGRCNREMDGTGEFHIFRAPSNPPSKSLRRGLAVTMEFLNLPGFSLDLNNPELFPRYFREVLNEAMVQTDAVGLAEFEGKFDFPEVEKRFRMIDDEGESVLATYGDWKPLLAQLRNAGPNRKNLRALQRYFVQLHTHEVRNLMSLGVLEPLYQCAEPKVWAIRDAAKVYDLRFGFGWQGMENPEPENLIA